MGETTRIGWTDFTWNSWWGCHAISPACDHCYAATFDRRTGGNYFEEGVLPRRTGEKNWNLPRKKDREAAALNRRLRVFLGSMMDWADNRVPTQWREDAFQLIRETPNLDWQLLTKRAPNIAKMLPPDWGSGYSNVWIGVTVEDRKHGVPRIEHLRRVPARVRFLSIEPLLEDLGELDLRGIHWVIIGGESGPGHRPINPLWVERIVAQCRRMGIAVFFKQWGGARPDSGGCELHGSEIKEWPLAA